MAAMGDSAEDWEAAGIPASEAASFREWKVDLPTTRRWRRAGVTDGLSAARWSILGSAPERVPDWIKAGIDLDEGFRWRNAGFGLAEARYIWRTARAPTKPSPNGSRRASSPSAGLWAGRLA